MRPMRCALWTVVLIAALLDPGQASWAQEGRFRGTLQVEPLADGVNVKLVGPFGYVDAKGRAWDVPAGAVTDGASIPRVFWVSYPPFTGKYRQAAVIHDHYCSIKSRSWQDTHNVFYEAMLTAGEDSRAAKVMWAAVYHFGPRWGQAKGKRRGFVRRSVEDQQQFVRDIEAWVARADPRREEMAKAIDAGRIPE
jgi:Protein of unknown function (DUF1353)